MDINTKHSLLEFNSNVVTKLREKYNLDKGRMIQSVDILEDWVKKQKHFVNKNLSRRSLEITIISCKGSTEKAKQQIDKLCTFRTLLPKFFIDTDLRSSFKMIAELANVVVLPKMTKEHQRVFILKMNAREFTAAHYLEYYRIVLILSEYLRVHDYPDGFVAIEDFRDVNIVDLATKINPIELQQLMTILIEGFGARMKAVHIITQSKTVDILIKVIKPVLPEKIRARLHVNQTIEEIYDVIERDILPVDFGGKEKPLNQLQEEWIELLCSEEHENHLKIMKASCTDETKRQTDKFNEQYMGAPGSFRTLTVD